MPTVVITYEMLGRGPGRHLDLLRAAGFEVRYPDRPLATEADVIAALHGAEAVIAGGEYYTANVLANLPKLRVIGRAGVGYDRVDLDAATRCHIAVTITPAANHEAVAEHTLALLLGLTRFVVRHDREVRQGVWSKQPMVPLRGQTLGLIGLGRIGRSVAVRAAAFRLHLLAYDEWANQDFIKSHGIELVDLDTLLARSDFVSLHVPLSDQTRGLLNRTTLARMKRGSFVLNTARGGLIVEADLLEALQSGHLAGAGLDVFEQEPTPRDNPLLQRDNVLVSPHLAGGDTQSLQDMGADAAQNIIELARGAWPGDAIVNPDVRTAWRW